MSGLEMVATVGAMQGALVFVLIAFRFRRLENLPLAVLLVVFSLRLGTIPLWNAGTMAQHPWLYPLTTPLPFLFGPLLCLYARELRDDSGVPLGPVGLVHVAPYLIDLVLTSLIATEVLIPDYGEMIGAVFSGEPPWHLVVRNGAKVLVNGVYVGRAIWLAFRPAPSAEITPHQRLWLRWLVLTPTLSLALFAFVALAPQASMHIAEGVVRPFTLLAVAMAVLIYGFSFLLVIAPEVASWQPPRRSPEGTSDPVPEADRRIAEKVGSLLEDGAYRDSDLSLESLGRQLRVHPNRVSHAINRVYGTTFPELLHRYRIAFFLEGVRRGELAERTILDLAFDAGFSSKSTFNRVFRNATGTSPTQFCRSLPGKTG
jgi:AraC-like DNA-binding protein